jgi:hypothetical protein
MPYTKHIAVVFTPVDGRCDLDEAQARLSDRETSNANVKIIIHHSWITKTTTKYLAVLKVVQSNYPSGTVLTFLLNFVNSVLGPPL